jgi:type VI secretion system protein ImpL
LRWATNAPMVPDASVHQAWPRINGLSAGFDFSGNWALLRLIRAQAPSSADLNALQDRRPEVVAFDVPLKRNPNAATGGDSEVDAARVYMRFALTGNVQASGQPQKTMLLALPKFPTAAPLLGRTMSYIGRAASVPPIALTLSSVRSVSQ